MHTCPLPVYVGGPVRFTNVFVGGLPAATVGDTCTCVGPPDTIVQGSSSVFINGRPAARMGGMTSHGGVIIKGDFTVLIGDAGGGTDGIPDFDLPDRMDSVAISQVNQIAALSWAAGSGALGCEQC